MTLPQSGRTPGCERVVGAVEAVNERGVKVAGAWHNFSRYTDVPRPMKGAAVELEVKGGFIRKLAVVAPAATEMPRLGPESPVPPRETRERTSLRLAVLKAAAQFASTRPDAKSTDVLTIAERWEAWVIRPADAQDDE